MWIFNNFVMLGLIQHLLRSWNRVQGNLHLLFCLPEKAEMHIAILPGFQVMFFVA